jgi:sugar O-acyltransferase (sialic acid O-acetyltransferase NeuD family)
MSAKSVVVVGATAPDIVKLIAAINRAGSDNLVLEGFLDDDPSKLGTEFMGYPVLGTTAALRDKFRDFWVANNVARDMPTRQKLVRRLASLHVTRHLTLIHPSIDTSYSKIGEGSMLQEGVVLGPLCEIGDHCVLYARAIIGHECIVEDVVFVGNNAIVGARGRVGAGAFIGLNSVIIPYLTIGARSTIGAGSVVVRNVPPDQTVFGNPARAGVQPAQSIARMS